MQGSFSSDAAEKFLELMAAEGYATTAPSGEGQQNFSSGLNRRVDVWSAAAENFSETRGEYIDGYDYARCQKPDGSTFGTDGKCLPPNKPAPLGVKSGKSKAKADALEKEADDLMSGGRRNSRAMQEVARRLREEAKKLRELDSVNHSELGATMDFARCVRPDGSSYGTRGKCLKGVESREEMSAIDQLSRMLPKGEKIVGSSGTVHIARGDAPSPQKKSLKRQIEEAYARETAARAAGDLEGARKAMREHMALTKKRDQERGPGGKSKEDVSREIMERIKAETDPQRQRELIRKLEDHNNPLVELPGGRVARTFNPRSPYEL